MNSIIAPDRPPHDVDNLHEKIERLALQLQLVEVVEPIQEPMDRERRHVGLIHRVDDRRRQVGHRVNRQAAIQSSSFVFRHAEAFGS